jgi:hypothetical protein
MEEKHDIEHIDFSRIDGIENVIRDAKIRAVFADAESWIERNHTTGEWKTFVRHPRYPQCTMTVEFIVTSKTGGTKSYTATGKIKRVIEDNGTTPVSALSKLARYSVLITEFAQKRHGGPVPTPEAEKIRIVQGWCKVKGKINQEAYAQGQWITARTLREWEKELEEQGKI